MDKTGPLVSIVSVLLFSMVDLSHAQSAACISGDFLHGSSGFVSSPNFPNKYPEYSRCIWNITVPSGFIVKLSFLHFELDPLNRDRVTIKDDGSHPLQLYGQRLPSPVYSMGNSVLLIFTSVNNQYPGFHATYNTDTYDSVCPNMTTLNQTSGVITSPFYPRHYPSKQICSWQITAETGKYVVLVIDDFDIHWCWPLCTCDYLEIQHGLHPYGASRGRKCVYHRVGLIYYSIKDVLKVKFVSDGRVNRWYRGFKATFNQVNYTMATSACISGDFLNRRSGFVSSPNFPNRYPQYSRCIWNIAVPSGYIIKLSFLHFELDSYPNRDRVTLTNIASDDGRHPFQLYGQRLPSPVYSVGNSIQLIFTSVTNQYSGFNATYTAITYETVCPNMKALNETSGVITSPFYRRYYPSNQTCSWQITAETGKYVVLVFEYFDIGSCGSSCMCDYLEIQNGLSSNGVSSGRECGYYNYHELVYYSINNVLKVTFVSDGGVYRWNRGFNATYTQVNFTTATSACISGDYLDGSSGFISSPNFPNKYPAYSRCIWNITVPSGYIIKLSFLHFELDPLNRDRVTIRDDGRHPVQLYGQRPPAPVYSMGNSIQLIFTCVNNQYSGFNVTYKAVTYETVCPNMTTLNQTSGVITSPFYPRHYPSKQTCSWQITAKTGKYVVLVFEGFNIDWCGTSCTCDYLEIQNGLSSDGASSGRKCGYYDRARLAYYSINEVLKVKFVSDGSVNNWWNIGFMATFTQVNYTMVTSACYSGDFLNGSSGFVSSPNFPNKYPPYSRCTWNISVPSGYIIKLSFLHFELDSYPHSDRVTLTNIASDDGRHPFQLYGQRLPSPVYSVGNSIQLIFTSVTNQYSGFNATYKAITYESVCPTMTTLNKTSGVITSPFYPRYYPSNQHCSWKITAETGRYVVLVIEDFYIESCASCTCDYLEIENVLSSVGASSGRKCGYIHRGLVYVSIKRVLKMMFVSYVVNRWYRGFKATFTQVNFNTTETSACNSGDFLHGSTGFVSSPNFPNKYPAYSRCVWNITVPSGNIIKLSFLHFELDPYSNLDHVTLTNIASDDGHHPFQLFGQRLPSPAYSTGNSIQLIFTSGTNQYSGFNATYKAITYESVCPNMTTLNQTSGVITSPFYPRHYPSNQICSWQIAAETGKYVVLVIDDFDIRRCWPLCTCDYLEIQNGLSSDGDLSGQKCGRYYPVGLAYYSKNDVLNVKFVSDGRVNRWYRGFKATFTQVNYTTATSVPTSGNVSISTPKPSSPSSATTTSKDVSGSTMSPTTTPSITDLITTTSTRPVDEKIFKARITLEEAYLSSYSDLNSPESRSFIRNFTANVEPIFLKRLSHFKRIEVTKLSSGSLVVDFDIVVEESSNATNSNVDFALREGNSTGVLGYRITGTIDVYEGQVSSTVMGPSTTLTKTAETPSIKEVITTTPTRRCSVDL